MSGATASDLSGSAKGTLRWNWTSGALPQLTSTPLHRFDRWSGNGKVAKGAITIGSSEITGNNVTAMVTGTIGSDRSLDLKVARPPEAGTSASPTQTAATAASPHYDERHSGRAVVETHIRSSPSPRKPLGVTLDQAKPQSDRFAAYNTENALARRVYVMSFRCTLASVSGVVPSFTCTCSGRPCTRKRCVARPLASMRIRAVTVASRNRSSPAHPPPLFPYSIPSQRQYSCLPGCPCST